ncbi:FGGY family carbohydrate kinase [Nocardioides currus]|uniref:Carbohydrate kinase FGGY N-terminal domain-containing protein n=1 Tax=Nocardioides currus TaxID=2133958 RepID=A0A2R7YW41_9ACTN|nr:FGGY family carbohydrate kinase [Nocardioides currus]PUA80588.1 hypothetical protein C7S10_12565 [Nocardioides currus]
MSVLAIDAGTAGVTAVVVDPDGRVVARAHQDLAAHAPRPGWLEQAPEGLWQATLRSTREVLADVDATEVTSLGITNERGTLVLWDRETLGSPRPAIDRADRRGADVCARLRDAGLEDRVRDLTGLRPDAASPAAKLGWLAEHEPHTWALVEAGRYAIGTLDSYLVARMTRGTWHVTDASNARRTLLLGQEENAWSDELCHLFGVPPDALPDVVPSWTRIAPTDPSVFLGLSLPIAGIAGDEAPADPAHQRWYAALESSTRPRS